MHAEKTALTVCLVKDALLAGACGLLFYTAVMSFERPSIAYHAAVSYNLIYWSSLLMVGFLLLGHWRPLPKIESGVLFGVFAGVIVLSTLMADAQIHAWSRFRLYYAVGLFGGVVWFGLRACGTLVLPATLAAIGLVHAAVLVLVLMASGDADSADKYNQAWVPYHSHIRHVAYHGMIAASAGVSMALLGGRLRLLGYVIAVVSLFGIAYFGARGALLGWLVFAFLAIVLLPHRLRTVIACAVVVLIALLASKLAHEHLQASPFTGNMIERVESVEAVVHSTGRTEIWADAWIAIKDRPLLGYGPDGYLTSRCCRPGTSQPHNTIVQILIEFGVLGLLSALALLWQTVGRHAVRVWQRRGASAADRENSVLLAMIGGVLVFALVDGLFYHVVPMVLMAILFALWARSLEQGNATTHF